MDQRPDSKVTPKRKRQADYYVANSSPGVDEDSQNIKTKKDSGERSCQIKPMQKNEAKDRLATPILVVKTRRDADNKEKNNQ